MSAIGPICVMCRQEMVCVENGVTVNDPSRGPKFPSTYWSADKYQCPQCRHEIITGISDEGTPGEDVLPEDLAASLGFQYAHYKPADE